MLISVMGAYFLRWLTYQVANNNLALTISTGSLRRRLLSCSITSLLGGLLHASDGSGCSRSTRGPALVPATANSAARDDLVQRSIELARHVEKYTAIR